MSIPAQINTLRNFTHFSDPGHGWLAVPCAYLRLLNIEDKISRCSYISDSGKTAYLEEDCDAGAFCMAWLDRFGNKPMMRARWGNGRSRIRNLRSYSRALTR